MMNEYLYALDHKNIKGDEGNKATGLLRLRALGMRVPRTFFLTGEAYRKYQQDDTTLINGLLGEIERKLDLNKAYAVRSSANLEDGFDHSFAGQFKTALNVCGRDALMQAIWSIWATTRSSTVREYLLRRGIPDDNLRMAVIVQEMVPAAVSGVAFSRNPITGSREIVIEAVEGSGARLVQDGITPRRWTFRAGRCTAQPETSPIPAEVVEAIAHDTARLARRLRKELDLEWVYDGHLVSWVQLREITTIRSLPVYSNKLAREVMGGMIKPLIWSINVPMVNGAWIRMLTEVIGPNTLTPNNLAKSFHYRAYFNMGRLGEVFESLGFPGESLEMLSGIAPKSAGKFKFRPGPRLLAVLPRLVRFVWDKWTLTHRMNSKLTALEDAYRQFEMSAVPSLSPEDLVKRIEQLIALNGEAAYYNIVVPLSMNIYNTLLGGQLKKVGIDPASLDMGQSTPDFQQFNPAYRLAVLQQQYQGLAPDLQALVCDSTGEQLKQVEGLNSFRSELNGLMERFGHLADNGNDFSSLPWRENRETILKLITGNQPHKQDAAFSKITLEDLRLPFGRSWLIHRLYHRTRQFILLREQISYLYSYGYGLFRPHILALGAFFTRQGWLAEAQDIFYLEWPAIRAAVLCGSPETDLRAVGADHKQAMEESRDAVLPVVIYGDQAPPVQNETGRRLAGTATSRGYSTGQVCVVHGLQDFGKVRPGSILVIPYSDVGWTPLFASAAGVIAESGGMLSHSSIIAREYGIPAVVSVPYAMQLADGTLVSIDGYKGEIIVHEKESDHARS